MADGSHDAAPPAEAATAAIPAADGAAFTDEELAIAVRVMKVVEQLPDAEYATKRFRGLRIALAPLVKRQAAAMYEGGDPNSYRARAMAKQHEAARRQRMRQLDRDFINKVKLRAVRLERLAKITEADPDLPLVPDGVAHVPSAPPHLLTDDVTMHDSAAAGDVAAAASGATSTGGDVDMLPTAGDAASASSAPATAATPAETEEAAYKLQNSFRSCYICKRRYQQLHTFYDQLCPACAATNWEKRAQSTDMRGRIALVTGARVKIGYHCALKLLRAGAVVIATSRFPHDTAQRYAQEPDYAAWRGNLHVYGLDLRHLAVLEAFCAMLDREYTHLDIIINNACQTIRRPPAYYAHMMGVERTPLEALSDEVKPILERDHAFRATITATAAMQIHGATRPALPAPSVAPEASTTESICHEPASTAATAAVALPAVAVSAEASQLALVAGDDLADATLFPTGRVDVNAQQVDLRKHNSWVMLMDEVSTPELAEVFAINSIAPYVLNARLKALMQRNRVIPEGLVVPTTASKGVAVGDSFAAGAVAELESLSAAASVSATTGKRTRSAIHKQGNKLLGEVSPPVPASVCRFIVNVSAMEGKFNRFKLAQHPHTNMAKAALNMMTRTAATDYANAYIFMTAVDTGWINEENPLERAVRTAVRNRFQTPLDEVDAAARVCDPFFAPLLQAANNAHHACMPIYGAFLKDYTVSEW